METTKNPLSPYASIFFNKLSIYLDTPLYYYGSIQRIDYFPNLSDIDVDIFTPNETATISQMQNFFNNDKKKFKKFVYRLQLNKKLVTGYKIMYKDPKNSLNVEFSIYNEKYKTDILNEHGRKTFLPYFITILLLILKFFYYKLCILPKIIYKPIKQFFINTCIDGSDAEFVVIDMKEPDDE
jgi:hypothetical protein